MKKNNSIVITSIISAGVLIIALSFLFVLNSSSVSENVLEVQGTATVKAMPDLTVVYIGIENVASTSEEVGNLNSAVLEKLIEALASEGFESSDLETINFNIYPNYEWVNGVRKGKGYIASHTLAIEMLANDTLKVGRVVNLVLESGATVSSISFKLNSESQIKYKAEALKLASEDARRKAEAVAEGFGKSVGKLVSVQVNDYNYSPWIAYDGIAKESYDEASLTTSIQPREEEIYASVIAVFKM